MSTSTTNDVKKLAAYKVGQVVHSAGAKMDKGRTKPPPRYTEDTLLADMMKAWKFATTPEEQFLLKQTEGIGTARTRGPTIQGLIERKLLSSKKRGKVYELMCTQMGADMLSRLPQWLMDVSTTAKWEMILAAVEKGEARMQDVVESQINYVTQIVERAKKEIQ